MKRLLCFAAAASLISSAQAITVVSARPAVVSARPSVSVARPMVAAPRPATVVPKATPKPQAAAPAATPHSTFWPLWLTGAHAPASAASQPKKKP